MLKRTPLFEIHKKLGARMVEFGGWEMPVQYTGVIEEHRAVRNSAGLFDISHMGEIFVTGEHARDFVNLITTNDISKILDGQCQYAACCYEKGGVVDDVISYRFNPKKYLIIVNASNVDKDFEWFQKNKTAGVTLENKSSDYSLLALQGPKAQKILQPLVDYPLDKLVYYHFCETKMGGKPIILSRTGYTGEDGFEICGAWDDAPVFWELLMKEGASNGLQPIGLGARDTLRLEAAYSLYGHEIGETINPLEARLGWVVKLGSTTLDKSDFIGKKALQEIKASGIKRNLVGIEMVENGIPRQGYEVFSGERKIGVITSGTFSPTLNKAIGLALVESGFGAVGSELLVQVRRQKLRGQIVNLPFYKRK
ncbi:MAG: glycine cleavage system aminomethyltransferase GcvT [Deltaproteobacteria bacterium]|nr:glycine cleavage system aminomethyltransferase GcvT [Deltaproteobacteria bacterium]